MRRRLVVLTASLCGALVLALLPVPPPAEAKASVPTVNIGLLSNLFRDAPEPLIQVMAKPFKSLMEDQAGFVAQIVVTTDADQMAQLIKENKIQLGVFNGFEFAWARLKNPQMKTLAIAVNQQPFSRALLVVRQDSKAVSPDGLEGKTLALPRLAREHCRLFAERRCVRPGLSMEKWFDKVSSPRTPQDALDDVAENFAQATVVEDIDLEAFAKLYPKTAARLRVLAESEIFPCGVLAYQPGGMDEEMAQRLKEGLIAAKTTERGRKLLELCRISGFEAVPANYEKNLIDIRKAYPPPVK